MAPGPGLVDLVRTVRSQPSTCFIRAVAAHLQYPFLGKESQLLSKIFSRKRNYVTFNEWKSQYYFGFYFLKTNIMMVKTIKFYSLHLKSLLYRGLNKVVMLDKSGPCQTLPPSTLNGGEHHAASRSVIKIK